MKRFAVIAACLLTAVVATGTLLSASASAHWCDDNWGSSFNLTVKPETDTVAVPASGSAEMVIWVQNNMGYALKNFTLDASAAGYTVSVSRDAPTVANNLMPGEKLRHTLTVTKSGGDNLSVESLEFYVSFGDPGQSSRYGDTGGPVMVKKTDGTLYPGVAGAIAGNAQAVHHRFAAQADFGDTSAGIDGLVQEYCAGRASWDHTSSSVITTYCADPMTTSCSALAIFGSPTKYDLQKLWVTYEVAMRKSALGSRLGAMRARLQCGWNDPHLTFQALAAFTLGYLGEDAGARTFLEGIISSGTADEAAIAKASLLLMGNGADLTLYGADVNTNKGSGTFQVADVSAAALAIVNDDDTAVQNVLLQRASWMYPEADTSGFLASHLLGIVAWDRRVWAAAAGDTGSVTFYGEAGNPVVTPGAPECSAASVSPLSGEVPLTITMNATGCTDPDGDNLSFSWTIESTSYSAAIAEHTFDEPGNYEVHLTVTDDSAVPLQSIRSFSVVVTPVGGGAGTGGAGAGGTTGEVGGAAGGVVSGTGGGGVTSGTGGGVTGGTGGSAGGTSSIIGGWGGTDGATRTRSDSGCGCSLAGQSTSDGSTLLIALLIGSAIVVRRRRRG